MNRCFVIGPIGDRHAPLGSDGRRVYEEALEVLEKVVEPACEAVGLEPIRADQISAPGEITDQIFRHLRDDEVVIADVSGGNPNVMYELGLRHSVNKLTVQVGEYGQIPFDVKNIRTIQFSRSRMGLIDARKELIKALEVGLVEGNDPVAATRIWLSGQEIAPVPAALETRDEVPVAAVEDADIDEAEWLERLVVLEEKFPELTEVVSDIGGVMLELGAITDDATERVQDAVAREINARARLNLIADFAKKIDEPSKILEDKTRQYASLMSELDEAVRGIAITATSNPDLASSDDFQEFVRTVSTLASSARSSMENVSLFGSAAQGLGSLSRLLKEPGRRISSAVGKMSEATSVIDEWDRLLRPLKLTTEG